MWTVGIKWPMVFSVVNLKLLSKWKIAISLCVCLCVCVLPFSIFFSRDLLPVVFILYLFHPILPSVSILLLLNLFTSFPFSFSFSFHIGFICNHYEHRYIYRYTLYTVQTHTHANSECFSMLYLFVSFTAYQSIFKETPAFNE